ncbi:MAG: hypothetical protein AAB639_03420 [Patescibacteria group bacterium]
MKKDLVVVLLIFIITSVFWRGAFFNFFAQDDFILINHFSQNNILVDFQNAIGYPAVTHWRPFHNLYFLIAGNLFGKNFALYHLLTFLIHIAAGFFVFKIGQNLTKSNIAAGAAALFYTVHPAHFVSMFWIAGGATVIGFLFFVISFWSFVKGQKVLTLIFFICALAASEAMISGIVIFAFFLIANKQKRNWRPLLALVLAGLVFIFVKLVFTSPEAFEIYKIEISTKTLVALQYYILRILGFAEISGDKLTSLVLVILWAMVAVISSKSFLKNPKQLILPSVAAVAGFFPFILIPSHLSPHYMNLSIWGLSMVLALALKRLAPVSTALILAVFLTVSFVNIDKTQENNWVVKRSNLAKGILADIETKKLADGSTIIFSDTPFTSSKETYIALGQGRAIDFWFDKKNYKTCFTFLENCAR